MLLPVFRGSTIKLIYSQKVPIKFHYVIYFDGQYVTMACAGSNMFWGALRGLN